MAASADAQEFGFEVSMAQIPNAFQLTSVRQHAAGQLRGVGSRGALRLVRTLLPSGRLRRHAAVGARSTRGERRAQKAASDVTKGSMRRIALYATSSGLLSTW